MSTTLMVVSIVVLFLVLVMFVGYMFYLQRHFLAVCRETKQLPMFAQAPAGLPAGTIRSILTLIIVAFALYLLVLAVFHADVKFPEVLAAILTTVIGFYFGSRTATGGSGDTASEELQRTRKERDDAIADKDDSKAADVLKKVGKGLKMAQKAARILPEGIRDKYSGALEKLESGAEIAKGLLGQGDKSGALAKAEEVFSLFKKENPFKDIVSNALKSFAGVAGISVPPVALIGAVVGISAALIGAGYARWKARILRLPFSPAVVPLKLRDPDMGFVLLAGDAVLREAFQTQLSEREGPFLEAVTQDFLTREEPELWEKYGESFDSREDFAQGLEAFRLAVATEELKGDIDPALLQEVGGIEPLLAAIDKIQQDDAASADLDMLMEMTEGLQKANEPVKSIFDKVRTEVEDATNAQ